MDENQVGVVSNYYAKIGVAAIRVTSGSIKTGDLLQYKGHTTDFTAQVSGIEIERQPVEEAHTGDLAGVKVTQRVRENDKVYKVDEQPET